MNIDLPPILKLHGSPNWSVEGDQFQVGITRWTEFFEERKVYAATDTSRSHEYPILLPFWEKPIEDPPWLHLWQHAIRKLRSTECLVVWGSSLPTTDVKAEHLFSFGLEARIINLCVIDPSEETQRRWRQLLPAAKYWRFDTFLDFQNHPPAWWIARPERLTVSR
jgi:hypothetical protein